MKLQEEQKDKKNKKGVKSAEVDDDEKQEAIRRA